MNHLLARHAECMFWLGRYVERTESLARILMVQSAFDRGRAEGAGWAWILTLYDEAEAFRERYGEANCENVIRYYVTDPEHAGSIVRSLGAARDNARALRALISTDFWVQINRLYKRLKSLPDVAVSERRLAQTCEGIQTDCYALLGIAEATFYRDSGWRFFRLGVEIERADQMSRVLDVRFAQLKTGTADKGDRFGDFAFWSMLLRSCGGHHAYRRLVAGPLEPESVARFLIFDNSFARSLAYVANQISRSVSELRYMRGVPVPDLLVAQVTNLSENFERASKDAGLISGLHRFNDETQRMLAGLASSLAHAYFPALPEEGQEDHPASADGSDDERVPPVIPRSSTMSQSQSSGIGSQDQNQS